MLLIAAPTGSGKTTRAVEFAARAGGTCWLCDRTEDVDKVAKMIEGYGGDVGRVLPLDGETRVAAPPGTDGTPGEETIPNCLHAGLIGTWQEKGYDYRRGFRPLECDRQGDPVLCPFLGSIDRLEHADSIVVTKAMARGEGFFNNHGNDHRENVIIDEDPVGLLRTAVEVARDDLGRYIGSAHGPHQTRRRRPPRPRVPRDRPRVPPGGRAARVPGAGADGDRRPASDGLEPPEAGGGGERSLPAARLPARRRRQIPPPPAPPITLPSRRRDCRPSRRGRNVDVDEDIHNLLPRPAGTSVRGVLYSQTEEDRAMTEENRRRVEDARHSLGEFLDRLAKAVADGLARPERVRRPPRRRPEKPSADGGKVT